MSTQELKTLTGMSTFFEAYKWLVKIGRQDAEYMTAEKDGIKIPIPIQLVKSKAMAEVMSKLPSKATVDVMHELVESRLRDRDIHSFLNNLLTRD